MKIARLTYLQVVQLTGSKVLDYAAPNWQAINRGSDRQNTDNIIVPSLNNDHGDSQQPSAPKQAPARPASSQRGIELYTGILTSIISLLYLNCLHKCPNISQQVVARMVTREICGRLILLALLPLVRLYRRLDARATATATARLIYVHGMGNASNRSVEQSLYSIISHATGILLSLHAELVAPFKVVVVVSQDMRKRDVKYMLIEVRQSFSRDFNQCQIAMQIKTIQMTISNSKGLILR